MSERKCPCCCRPSASDLFALSLAMMRRASERFTRFARTQRKEIAAYINQSAETWWRQAAAPKEGR